VEKMTKKAEQQMIGYVSSIVDAVHTGQSPTDALFKVASDNSLPPQVIQRLAEAYNQSRTLFEMNEKRGSRDIVFPVARASDVVSKLYPETPLAPNKVNLLKQASAVYQKSTTNFYESVQKVKNRQTLSQHEKVAAVTNALEKKKEKDKQLLKPKFFAELQSKKAELSDAKETMLKVASELSQEFRSTLAATPFYKFEIGLHQKYGSAQAPVIADLVWRLSGCEKLGQRRAVPRDFDASKYTLIDFLGNDYASVESLVKAATKMHKTTQEIKVLEEAAGFAHTQKPPPKEKISPEGNVRVEPESTTESNSLECPEKKAFELPSLASMPFSVVGGAHALTTGSLASDPLAAQQKEVTNAVTKFEDPNWRDSLQSIKIRTMLHDLMTNDEVISGYDENEVIDAFNEIHDIAPQASTNSAVMRDMLRRRLVQGGVESMELGQLAQLNKSLQEGGGGKSYGDQLKSLAASDISQGAQLKGLSK